ncbi:type II secretion system F family protein [Aestuariibaculum sp. M13]|uniref:type II secretion system F family protein n=1 Tax=unclassified Aestuariibaculum TaxID=2646735 RepID=UPI002159F4FD|nr:MULTISPECIES: type II secretion system F family protein [unclassified Aestuariibaculum]MCR8667516.1 type II secretion system F family protein [Aestuariibaculum sp. M13]WMI65248.1 type II secretion system F family protein [Aestuariibaculum sp. YM273]
MAFKLDSVTNIESRQEIDKQNGSFLKKEIHLFNKVFSNKVKEDFYTELSVLLNAGITLKEALELILSSQKKIYNKTLLSDILNDVISGQSLSETLSVKNQFSQYEYYSIKIGEDTGTLALVSEQLGSFFAKKNEQKRNLISALSYPMIILTTAVLVVIFMLRFVVPMFQDIFRQQKVELPGITKFIIGVSDFMGDQGWYLLVLIVLLFVLRSLFNKKKWFNEFKGTLVLKIPFIGHFVKLIYLSQFTQAVSLLVASKVPLVNSIQLVKQMIMFYPLQEALGTVERNILKGESLSFSLKQHKLFDDKMVALVKVAEETNQTEFIFSRLNMQYNNQVQQQSKVLSTIMEPFIILIVGIFVGIILIAMYLPMFKLSSVLG